MSARFHVLILSFLFFFVHLVLFWHYGIRVLWDSAAYIEAADFVVANRELQDIHHLYYSVPILIMAAFRVLFPGTLIPILLFQCLLSVIATIALYKSAEKVFNSSLAGLMAGVVFIIWLDNVHWNTTTMTESITRSIFCFVVYVVANWKNRLRDTIALALLMIVVFFTRPTGIIPIIGAIVFVIVYNWKSLVEKPPVLISVALISTAAIVFGADRMLAHWDFTDQYL
ncbi:MAG TPA: glycosyltransferase family 39 protein, partial [Chryseolinea sp.]